MEPDQAYYHYPDDLSTCSGDDDTDDGSDSFDKRQLIGAETDDSAELLPEVEGLRIAGEARLGHTIQATGFSLNGTVRCEFAWLRLYDNGSQIYIPGGNKPEHLVTADDIDSYLAVEVIPIGKKDQMGDLVRVFANEHKKITCGNKIQDIVEQNFFDGHASFDVYLKDYPEDSRTTVKLEFMKDRFIVKDKKMHTVAKRKFLPDMTITIPKESPTGFEISREAFHTLRLEAESSALRDLIVLTMRAFLLRATQKPQKKKRRCFFF